MRKQPASSRPRRIWNLDNNKVRNYSIFHWPEGAARRHYGWSRPDLQVKLREVATWTRYNILTGAGVQILATRLDQACCISKHRARGQEMGNQRQGNHICTSVHLLDCQIFLIYEFMLSLKLKSNLNTSSSPFEQTALGSPLKQFLNVSSHLGYVGESENSGRMHVNYFKLKTVCLASAKYSCHDAQAVLRLKPI